VFCALSRGAAPAEPAPHWWQREPLRIINLVNALSLTIRIPPAELAARKVDQGYNVEHFEATDMRGGLDDDHLYFKTKAARRQNPDYLGAYLPAAKARGLRVIVYFDVHWYKPSFAERHPDWVQRREDGSALSGMYNVGTNFCVNSPWRDWVLQVVRDLAAYPIDGIFFDGPIFSIDTCYCQSCRTKFRNLYGGEMPSKKLRRGPAFRRLVEFQANSLRDFLHDAREAIHSVNPEIAFYMNGGGRQANWPSARLNRYLTGEQDLIGFEGGVLRDDLSREAVWKPSVAAKLLETQAGGKPRVVFCASKQSPWPFSVLPEPETRLMYAQTIANGANVWMGVMPPDLKVPEMQAVVAMNRFVAHNARYFLDTRSEATTALVWSDDTANYYGHAGMPGDPDAAFRGMADALESARVPFDVIDDVSLAREDLSRYAAIFLPNVACMSGAAAQRLRSFVSQGGRLFATLETSLYDEAGVRRADFALADVFGVAVAGPLAGRHHWDLMQPVSQGGLLDGVRREVLPSPLAYMPVLAREAGAVLRFMQPLDGPYEGMPQPSSLPALLRHPYGRGEAIYSSGDLDSAIHAYHMAEHLQIVENVSRLTPAPVRLENGPRSMEVTLRSQDHGRRLLLHLINYTGEMVRPIRQIVPVENLRIRLPGGRMPARVFTLMQPRELRPARAPGGGTEIVLPHLDEYEVVVIER